MEASAVSPHTQNTTNDTTDVEIGDGGSEDLEISSQDIKTKLVSLLKYSTEIDGTFTKDEFETLQLQSLKAADSESVGFEGRNQMGLGIPNLHRYNCKVKTPFLGLTCEPSAVYVRSGYEGLYNCVLSRWNDPNFYRVVLIGNAGTGKSWFQVYALKKLLDEKKREYDIVIRQVGKAIYVIDLAQAVVYYWEVKVEWIQFFSTSLTRTLYFFEPGGYKEQSPLEVFIPSLSTLSPYEKRISEYSKRLMTRMYFWPWTVAEMWAIVCDAGLGINFDDFYERVQKFGGILRNVLGEDGHAEHKLKSRLRDINVDLVTKAALNVDRDTSVHGNISGFLVCYNNRSIEGDNRFSRNNLEYTSVYVEEKVHETLGLLSFEEKMQIILKRMDGEMIDLSGKCLEDVSMALLSKGTVYSWESHEFMSELNPTPSPWLDFDSVAEKLGQPGNIIAPTKVTFPVVDFLYSSQNMNGPVVSFQCTWQQRDPFTLRALYDLRANHLKIDDSKELIVYLISPGNEEIYLKKKKEDFLDGALKALTGDLQFTNEIRVPFGSLESMWQNTKICYLRPAQGYSFPQYIRMWLSGEESEL